MHVDTETGFSCCDISSSACYQLNVFRSAEVRGPGAFRCSAVLLGLTVFLKWDHERRHNMSVLLTMKRLIHQRWDVLTPGVSPREHELCRLSQTSSEEQYGNIKELLQLFCETYRTEMRGKETRIKSQDVPSVSLTSVRTDVHTSSNVCCSLYDGSNLSQNKRSPVRCDHR